MFFIMLIYKIIIQILYYKYYLLYLNILKTVNNTAILGQNILDVCGTSFKRKRLTACAGN